MSLPELLLRLLIGALVFWFGEKIISLISNPKLAEVLTLILIFAVVLYVIFGAIIPIR